MLPLIRSQTYLFAYPWPCPCSIDADTAATIDAVVAICYRIYLLPYVYRGLTYLVKLAADSTGLLSTEIKGKVLLALVELAQVSTLLLVHNSKNTSNVLAQRVDAKDLAR